MAIYSGSTILEPYKGYYKPVNIYAGAVRKGGWVKSSVQMAPGSPGVAVEQTFSNTYDDVLDAEIYGASTISSAAPSPQNPATYADSGGGTLETSDSSATAGSAITLPVLRSIGNYRDRLQYAENRLWEKTETIFTHVFTGTEAGSDIGWAYGPYSFDDVITVVANVYKDGAGNPFPRFYERDNAVGKFYCSHFEVTAAHDNTVHLRVGGFPQILFYVDKTQFPTLASFRTWLNGQHLAGTPVQIRYVKTAPETKNFALGELKTYPKTTKVKKLFTGGVGMGIATVSAKVADG